jgi:Rod binding domain-containing protein
LEKINYFGQVVGATRESNPVEQKKEKDLLALQGVAQTFEAYFYQMILKNSRQIKLSEGLTEESQVFSEMLDKNFSEIIAKRNSSEISQSIINQFKKYI